MLSNLTATGEAIVSVKE